MIKDNSGSSECIANYAIVYAFWPLPLLALDTASHHLHLAMAQYLFGPSRFLTLLKVCKK